MFSGHKTKISKLSFATLTKNFSYGFGSWKDRDVGVGNVEKFKF